MRFEQKNPKIECLCLCLCVKIICISIYLCEYKNLIKRKGGLFNLFLLKEDIYLCVKTCIQKEKNIKNNKNRLYQSLKYFFKLLSHYPKTFFRVI